MDRKSLPKMDWTMPSESELDSEFEIKTVNGQMANGRTSLTVSKGGTVNVERLPGTKEPITIHVALRPVHKDL